MYDVLEGKAEIWNQRLSERIKGRFHSQAAFADAMNQKYGTSFNQRTVSRWVNVGAKAPNGTRGFPEFSNMVMIAQILEVDLGYLIGETNDETFTMENASEYMGLSSEAVRAIKQITEDTTAFRSVGMMAFESKPLLNSLFTAKKFCGFIRTLKELDTAYSELESEKAVFKKLETKLGSEMCSEAAKWSSILDPAYDGPAPSTEALAAVHEFESAIDESYVKHENAVHDIRSAKYELSIVYAELIEELFPSI
ncbi:MAG TPA: hypothetical protein PKU80_12900 [Candidatus Limiplasma sp.]|nr:hypothetical protein [Candidatus Limiplasma sp.]